MHAWYPHDMLYYADRVGRRWGAGGVLVACRLGADLGADRVPFFFCVFWGLKSDAVPDSDPTAGLRRRQRRMAPGAVVRKRPARPREEATYHAAAAPGILDLGLILGDTAHSHSTVTRIRRVQVLVPEERAYI